MGQGNLHTFIKARAPGNSHIMYYHGTRGSRIREASRPETRVNQPVFPPRSVMIESRTASQAPDYVIHAPVRNLHVFVRLPQNITEERFSTTGTERRVEGIHL